MLGKKFQSPILGLVTLVLFSSVAVDSAVCCDLSEFLG